MTRYLESSLDHYKQASAVFLEDMAQVISNLDQAEYELAAPNFRHGINRYSSVLKAVKLRSQKSIDQVLHDTTDRFRSKLLVTSKPKMIQYVLLLRARILALDDNLLLLRKTNTGTDKVSLKTELGAAQEHWLHHNHYVFKDGILLPNHLHIDAATPIEQVKGLN